MDVPNPMPSTANQQPSTQIGVSAPRSTGAPADRGFGDASFHRDEQHRTGRRSGDQRVRGETSACSAMVSTVMSDRWV